MRFTRLVPLALALALAAATPAHAQGPEPLPAMVPLRFDSWQAPWPVAPPEPSAAVRLDARARNRTKNALIGGAIGAAAGVVFCTAISTLADDSADGGLSFCPLDSYLLIGGAGFLVGAAIGWAI